MSKNTIKIDGAKLKGLLEYNAKRSLYEISEDEGFSRNFLPQACRSGKASPIVQAVARNYGVEPEQYKLKDNDLKQMRIEDIETDTVSKKTFEKAVDLSRDYYNYLAKMSKKAANEVAEAFNEIAEAFEALKREWEKAEKEYIKEIEKIKEGLK